MRLACALILFAPQMAEVAGAQPSESAQLERFTLPNGLRVVLQTDRAAPTVAIALQFGVGSRDEPRGQSGFAHLIEHLLLRGEDFVRLIHVRGGETNATTDADRTVLVTTLPSSELELGLWVEAERLQALRFDEQMLADEVGSVLEERRAAYHNLPYALSYLRINQLAYGDYWPYAHPTIGEVRDIEAAARPAVQRFFADHYRAANATLTVVGDFDETSARRLIEERFATIPGDVEPATTATFEAPPQVTERRETMPDPHAELPAFHIAYHIPPLRHEDHYALELLAAILGDGQSARLHLALMSSTDPLCRTIEVRTDNRRGPDLFSMFGVMARGHAPAEARQRIFRELAVVAEQSVTEAELLRAQERIRAAEAFQRESSMARAGALGEHELFDGDAALALSDAQHYAEVSLEDIQRVARQYFAATNRSVLDVLPTHRGRQ